MISDFELPTSPASHSTRAANHPDRDAEELEQEARGLLERVIDQLNLATEDFSRSTDKIFSEPGDESA